MKSPGESAKGSSRRLWNLITGGFPTSLPSGTKQLTSGGDEPRAVRRPGGHREPPGEVGSAQLTPQAPRAGSGRFLGSSDTWKHFLGSGHLGGAASVPRAPAHHR